MWTAKNAADLGVSVDGRGQGAGDHAGGPVTRYKRDAEQYDVIVQTQAWRTHARRSNASCAWPRRRDDSAVGAGEGARKREPRELNHFGQRRSASITANLAPDYSLGRRWGSWMPRRRRSQAGLQHRPERHLARIPQASQGALAVVFVLALLFIFPGAGRTVRELCRPVCHHAVPGAAVMIGAVGPAVVRGVLNVYSQIGLIRGGLITADPDCQSSPTSCGKEGMEMIDALIASASSQRLRPIHDDDRRHGAGCGATGHCHAAGRKPHPDRLGDRGGMSLGTLFTIFRSRPCTAVCPQQGARRQIKEVKNSPAGHGDDEGSGRRARWQISESDGWPVRLALIVREGLGLSPGLRSVEAGSVLRGEPVTCPGHRYIQPAASEGRSATCNLRANNWLPSVEPSALVESNTAGSGAGRRRACAGKLPVTAGPAWDQGAAHWHRCQPRSVVHMSSPSRAGPAGSVGASGRLARVSSAAGAPGAAYGQMRRQRATGTGRSARPGRAMACCARGFPLPGLRALSSRRPCAFRARQPAPGSVMSAGATSSAPDVSTNARARRAPAPVSGSLGAGAVRSLAHRCVHTARCGRWPRGQGF